MKRMLSVLLVVVLMIVMLPAIAIPASAASSGKTGNCYWSLNGTVLTISGDGVMGNYYYDDTPWGKSITEVIIEPGVTKIGIHAFKGCTKLVSVSIGEDVNAISQGAFYECTGLTSIVIPDNVTIIDYSAFYHCSSLQEMTLPFVGKEINGTDDTHFGYIFSAPFSSHNKFYVPFSLKKVNITGGSVIDDYAFEGCIGLSSVVVGDNVTTIGSRAFQECENLTAVDISNSVTTIQAFAFYNCISLSSITIPNSVTTIGDSAFSGCESLSSINIGNGVTTIGSSSFSRCVSLETITLPNSVDKIGNSAFYNCTELMSVVIGDGITTIGGSAFWGCTMLHSINIPNSVTTIGDCAFYGCTNLSSIIIPNNVNTINEGTFYGCNGLISITISDSIIDVGDSAFYNCDSMESVWYTGTQQQSKQITVGTTGNTNLINAVWHYESCPVGAPHNYNNLCDVDCNECGASRVVFHAYVSDCDVDCNICGFVRVAGNHKYANLCDDDCDKCGAIRTVGNHYYLDSCDAICEECGMVRIIPHSYDNACDITCNICQQERDVKPHIYDNACDTSCNVCGAPRYISHPFGGYIYNNDATTLMDGTKTRTCSVCQKNETVTAAGTKLQNPFKDVKLDQYYTEPVLWAVSNKITNGTSTTTFSPDDKCTRGQIVTFLWRAAGSPEPKNTKNPFKDVKSNQYYYKAVLWAVEKGITKGTSSNTFSPDATCTRAQVVTFLWRAKGALKVSATNPFKDVKKSYYSDAVLWAVKNNITTGTTATTFSPDATCTRGQIVTFLFRAYQ